MGVKETIKTILIKEDWTITKLNEELNKRYNRETTSQNLNLKISKETLKYNEVLEIAEVLGYDIVWIKKNK